MSKYKPKGTLIGLKNESAYADGKTMAALTRYLCTVARPAGIKSVDPEACRNCESKCAFGVRFVQLYDAGEQIVLRKVNRTTRPGPKPKRREPETEGDSMTPVSHMDDLDLLRKQLAEAEGELESLRHENEELRAGYTDVKLHLRSAQESAAALEAECAELRRKEGVCIKKLESAERRINLANKVAENAQAEAARLAEEAEALRRSMPDPAELETAQTENRELRETVQSLHAKNANLLREQDVLRNALSAEEQKSAESMQQLIRLKLWMLGKLCPEINEI